MWYYIQAFERSAYAPVAQLDRVTDYESVGRGFESLLAYHFQPGIVKIPGFFLYFYGKNWKRLFCILGHLRELS